MHSNVSDGRLTPGDLVRLAHAQGVRVMALTDHDSTDGVLEAQRTGELLGVRVIPGVELGSEAPGASIHILGLFVDMHNAAFQSSVRQFRDARLIRAREMVDALARLGAPISLERVFEIAGEGSVGRPHVAQALMEAGHVDSIEQAFERFIGRNGPAYFQGFRLEPADAVRLIHAAGGLAAWAHPNELDGRDWRTYLPMMLEVGVDGLEVYYGKDYGPDVPAALLEACRIHGLVPTVGSDYHGFKSMDQLPGSVSSPGDLLERLEARVGRLRSAL